MFSTSKKSPKPKSSSSSNFSLKIKSIFPWEPPDDLFPSKDDLFRLVTAVAIAPSVFLSCNVFFSTRQLNPFCDSSLNASDFSPIIVNLAQIMGNVIRASWSVFAAIGSTEIYVLKMRILIKQLRNLRSGHKMVFVKLMLNICVVEMG